MDSNFPRRLIEGHRAFKAGRFQAEQDRYHELATKGQSPSVMVIGCVDSRVSPEAIFDAAPGEILVVRNVANLVPPYETGGIHHGVSASLEFGVCALHVKHIVILGHAFCGGVHALVSNAAPLAKSDFIGKWVNQLAPAEQGLGPIRPDDRTYMQKLEFASVELSLKNMLTFPFVADAVKKGELQLHGAYFGVEQGRLFIRDPQSGAFEPVTD